MYPIFIFLIIINLNSFIYSNKTINKNSSSHRVIDNDSSYSTSLNNLSNNSYKTNVTDCTRKESYYMDDIVLTESDLISMYGEEIAYKLLNEKCSQESSTQNVNLFNYTNSIKFQRNKRAATTVTEKLWIDGIIPYEINDVYTGDQIITFIKAMRLWEAETCILFVERNEQHTNWISILQQECGCCSIVGRNLSKGAQNVSLGKLCDKVGIAAHEFGHVIGFWHEHTRPDRDKYITVVNENIKPGQEINFTKKNSSEISSLNEPYDFLSIMHYSNNTFSKNDFLPTLKINEQFNNSNTVLMGQRNNLSRSDVAQTNKLYKCTSRIETFYDAQNTINLSKNEEFKSYMWRIKGPSGVKIQLKIESFRIRPVNRSCKFNYLSIYDGYSTKSKLLVKACGSNITNIELKSTQSHMILYYVANSPNERKYHQFTAKYTMVCGGKFTGSVGSISTPNFPDHYPTNITCEWLIEAPYEYMIQLKFVYFNLEQSNRCEYDYLRIFDGENETAVQNYTYCGSMPIGNIRSSGNKILIKFNSDPTVPSNGFMIQYSQILNICKTNEHGCQQKCVLTNLNSYECDCDDGFILSDDEKSCISDYSLNIQSTEEVECGGLIDATEIKTGIIKSPSDTKANIEKDVKEVDLYYYPENQDCKWTINAKPNNIIMINITHLDIEGDKGNCKYDFLNIYSLNDDNTTNANHGYFCDKSLPNNLIVSNTNRLGLNFKSDSSIAKTGFELVFVSDENKCARDNGGCSQICENEIGKVRCSCRAGYLLKADENTCIESNECNFIINDSGGNVSSPRFPRNYSSNKNCIWKIQTKNGHKILLTFKFFDIELSSECVYDHVSVEYGDKRKILCGSQIPPPIESPINSLTINLISDSSGEKQGFYAQFSSVCGCELVAAENEQKFYSHSQYGITNYPSNENCTWIIKSEVNKCILLSFDQFEIENSADAIKINECQYDFIEINGINSNNSTSLYGLYCGFRLPKPIISYSNEIKINFKTDSDQEYSGFIGVYKSIECNNKEQ